MTESTLIIAFDQHAASLVAAVLRPGERTPAIHQLAPDLPTIGRFVDRLGRRASVQCCYEAGPCGFELQRFLQGRHVPCAVIAPALIPRRPGVRIKTDRRDAMQLALLYRAGALTAVHVPTAQEEAARDLLRCREDVRVDLLRARHRLSKFLLRHGRRWTQTKAWSKRHLAWLETQRWAVPALEQTFQAYRRAVEETIVRLRAVEADLRDLLTLAPLRDRVVRLRCFRSIGDLTALTIAAEVGDASRFARARHFMGFTGLVPSEHSSGAGPSPGRHHENRQCASPTRPRRSRVALSPSARRRPRLARPPARRARARDSPDLGRAAALASALPAPRRPRQAPAGRGDGRGARARRLYLGGVDSVI